MGSFKITIENYDQVKAGMTANPEMAATPMDRRSESGQPIFFDVILDISGSMSEFYDELVSCFNEIMIPSLAGAAHRYKGPMRLGCLLFSKELVPAWRGFKSLKELGKKPLKRATLNQPGLQSTTALYGAMTAGILWTAAAMDHMRENGRGESPKSKIIVLTDGANNEPPKEEVAVVKALDSIGTKNRQALMGFGMDDEGKPKNGKVIGFFDTGSKAGGLTKSQFNTMVAATMFHGNGFYEIATGGTPEERQATFRHHFQIFSSQQ